MIKPTSEIAAEKVIRERFEKYKSGKYSRAGKAFENETRLSLLEIGSIWIYRAFDAKSFYSLTPNLQAPKQPFDFCALYNGSFYAFECKSYRQSAHSYPLSELVPQHQIDSLTQIKKNGGHSYFLICNRHKRNHYTCYALEPAVISEMMKYLEEYNSRSIRWRELEENGISLERIKKKMGVSGYGM